MERGEDVVCVFGGREVWFVYCMHATAGSRFSQLHGQIARRSPPKRVNGCRWEGMLVPAVVIAMKSDGKG